MYDTSPPEIKSNTAMLRWTFRASCIWGDNLIESTWKKNGHFGVDDKRFSHRMYCLDDGKKIAYELTIKNITTQDSGNYTCYLRYSSSIVHTKAVSTGSIFLIISGTHGQLLVTCFQKSVFVTFRY